MANLPVPSRYESKQGFMARCMGSSRVLGASQARIRDAMDRAVTDGPTLLTGFAPAPEQDRRAICEIQWEIQRKRFIAEAQMQGAVEDEEFGGGSFIVYVQGVYEAGVYE